MESTNPAPHAALTHEDPATGTGAQASTAPAVLRCRLGFFQAQAALHRAEADVQHALIEGYAADTAIGAGLRADLTASAQHLAALALEDAAKADARAAEIRAQLPIDARDVCAVGVVTITRDRIQLTARLVMGATQTVQRTWERTEAGGFHTRDPEFIEAEARLGTEFAEWMDGLELPGRVAKMLPRPPSPASTAAADAAREVRHG